VLAGVGSVGFGRGCPVSAARPRYSIHSSARICLSEAPCRTIDYSCSQSAPSRNVAIRNAPSPGATSCLAIAEYIAGEVLSYKPALTEPFVEVKRACALEPGLIAPAYAHLTDR
jgi:hypothetical protein